MTTEQNIDVARAHRTFSTSCFNAVWDLLEKQDRTVDENEMMLHCAHASLWHWLQRTDRTARNLSIGYWLLSRVYVVLGNATEAYNYGTKCLGVTPNDDPFCVSYAHEAIANAELLAGNHDKAQTHIELAMKTMEKLTDKPNEKAMLAKDLARITDQINSR